MTASDFLAATGYVMAAHNNQKNTVNYNPTLNNVPPNMYVWNRSWYLQQSGGNGAGNLTLNFNFNDYNGTAPNPADVFALLYNPSDGTFGSGTNTLVPTASTNVSGNSVSFLVNAANLPNGYYTIIYNPNSVLAITGNNFSVTKQSPNAALARWTASPEFSRGQFDLQRSANGLQYTSIATITAAENASAEIYSFTDNAPVKGINYYRLKMVDATGNISYSPIDILTFNETSREITLHPIPAKDVLYISAPGIPEPRNIELVSVTGQVLDSYSIPRLDGTNLSVSRLPAGSYFVHIWGGGQSIVLPFLKQ
jgi:hypothetical protein